MPVCDTPGIAPSSSAASVVLPLRAYPWQPGAPLEAASLSAAALPFVSLEALQELAAAALRAVSGAEQVCLARRTAGGAALVSACRPFATAAGAVAA